MPCSSRPPVVQSPILAPWRAEPVPRCRVSSAVARRSAPLQAALNRVRLVLAKVMAGLALEQPMDGAQLVARLRGPVHGAGGAKRGQVRSVLHELGGHRRDRQDMVDQARRVRYPRSDSVAEASAGMVWTRRACRVLLPHRAPTRRPWAQTGYCGRSPPRGVVCDTYASGPQGASTAPPRGTRSHGPQRLRNDTPNLSHAKRFGQPGHAAFVKEGQGLGAQRIPRQEDEPLA